MHVNRSIPRSITVKSQNTETKRKFYKLSEKRDFKILK